MVTNEKQVHNKRKTPMIVLHGFGVSSLWLNRYKESFSNDHNVQTPELPYSPNQSTPVKACVDSWAESVLNEYSSIFHSDTILIGESLGCAVAMSIVSKVSVSRLIMITPFVEFRVNMSDVFSLLFLPSTLIAKVRAKKSFPNSQAEREALEKMTGSLPKGKIIKTMLGQAKFRWEKYLPNKANKTLIISAQFDRLAPQSLIAKLSEKTDAQTFTIEKSGHQAPTKKWETIKSEIESFL